MFDPRALSPFQATSPEIESRTRNVAKATPRSRSSPKRAQSSGSPGQSGTQRRDFKPGSGPQSGSAFARSSPSGVASAKIVYPCSPGGTEIRPPPPAPTTGPAVGCSPSFIATGGDWGNLGWATTSSQPPPIPEAFKSLSGKEHPGSKGVPEEPTRVSLELPKLGAYDPSTSAIVAGDWLVSLVPTMTCLSATATEFWDDVMDTAREYYSRWLNSSPLERLHLQVDSLATRYRGGKYSRVDQRAVTMLMSAVGSELKDDIISLRLMGSCAIIFKVMCKFQPGGTSEKQQLLSYLVGPDQVTTSAGAVKALRKWRRWLARALELKLSVPDPSLQVRGLDLLAPPLSSTAAFRIQTFRTQALLDQSPSQEKVYQYSELLLAEAEEAVLSTGTDKGKRQTVARADEQKGKGGTKDGKGGAKGVGSGETPVCRLWKTDDGCRYGKACRFVHSALTPSDKRCFVCSSVNHRKAECPHAKHQSQGAGEPSKEGAKEAARKGQGGGGKGGASSSTADVGKTSRDDLLAKANAVLDTIQSSIKMIEDKSPYPSRPGEGEETGLIDSGATTSMRQRREGERAVGSRMVSLAQGEIELGVSAGGVLLAEDSIEPIVSLRQLVALGFRLVWTKRSCTLHDEQGIIVPVSVRSGCPRVTRQLALKLIDRVEIARVQGLNTERVQKLGVHDKVWQGAASRLKVGIEGRDKEGACVWHRVLCSSLFPEAPRELLDEVSRLTSGAQPPRAFNRRKRRSIEMAKGVILHLCCGSSRRAFDEVAAKHGMVVLAVDSQEDLNDPSTYSYILSLAARGKLKAVLSGFPCRTRSALRGRGEGPPVVRDRDGPGRWGKAGISAREEAKVWEDDQLMIRTFMLGVVAKWGLSTLDSEEERCFNFILENPQDPKEVFGECHASYPTLWTTAEFETLRRLLGLSLITLDQGPLGHVCRKPTTVACVSGYWPRWAMDLKGPGWASDEQERGSSEEWAKWSHGLCQAIRQSLDNSCSRRAVCVREVEELRRLRIDQSMRDHVLAGHIPYRRDCYACVAGRIRRPSHFRSQVSESFTLSLDLAGPFKEGMSEGCRARYFLAAVFSVPRSPELNGFLGAEPFEDPEEVPGAGVGDLPQEGPWEVEESEEEAVEVQEQDQAPEEEEPQPMKKLELVHLPFVAMLRTKGAREVLDAVKGIEARLVAMGCNVARLHTDAGGEFCNKLMREWTRARGIHKTNTGGDRFRANPFAENLIGILKGQARTLMHHMDTPIPDWPYALRHACAERFRVEASKLGWNVPRLVPFGAKVHVLQRSWHIHKRGEWVSRVVGARLLCPSRELSAGDLVRTDAGELLNTPCVFADLQTVDPDSFEIPPEKAKVGTRAVNPDVRVRGKTTLGVRPAVAEADAKGSEESAREHVARIQDVLSEDEQAWGLASSEHFCLDRASQFLLGTSWLQSPSGRSRVGVLDEGGFARVLGFYQHGGVTGVTREWARFPGFAKLLARMVAAVDPKHEFTTLTILNQTRAKPHRDTYNLPVSNLILPLRVPPSGGGIWVERALGDDARWVTPKMRVAGEVQSLTPFQPCYLDPHKWHATEGWQEGSRVLLVAYSLKGISRATAEQRRGLQCTGFRLPGVCAAGDDQQGGDLHIDQKVQKPTPQVSCTGHVLEFSPAHAHDLERSESHRDSERCEGRESAGGVESQGHFVCHMGRGDPGECAGPEWKRGILKCGKGGSRQASESRRVRWSGPAVECNVAEDAMSTCAVYHNSSCPSCAKDPIGLCSIAERDVFSYASGSLSLPAPLGRSVSAGWGARGGDSFVGSREGGQDGDRVDRGGSRCPALDALILGQFEGLEGDGAGGLFLEGPGELEACSFDRVCVAGGDAVQDPDFQQLALKSLVARECKIAGKGGYPDSELQHLEGVVEDISRLEQCCCKADCIEYSLLPDAEVLTTHTVPLDEVERHCELWADAVQEEVDSLVHEKKALKVIDAAELERLQAQGTKVTVIPSKVVCTRKAGGRFKARLVACGNHLGGQEKNKDGASLYAGGVDPGVLRQVASIATKRVWAGGATDIKTAFLNAELLDRHQPRVKPPPLSQEIPEEVIVLKVPGIVSRHGHLSRQQFMLVQRAVYGIDQSPRDWGITRDVEIASMVVHVQGTACKFEQSRCDSNLWFLRPLPEAGKEHEWREPRACLLVYVDDILAFAKKGLLEQVLGMIT